MRKYIILFIALCLHGLARGQTDNYSSYYWFDSQQGQVQTSPVLQGSFDVDAATLDDGIHTFHYLVKKDDGAISLPVHTYFLKATNSAPSGQITCLCTIDGELVHHELIPAEGGTIHWNLNVNDIADGLHQVQIDAIAADGAMSGSQHGFFVKVPKADTTIKGYYWFDEETDAREVSVAKGTFEVDASSLSDGFHQFHYYVLQANGVSSLPSTNYFLKTAQVNPDDELTCICTVDDELRHIEKLSQQGGVIHWNLDMQDLADGVHKIQLQAVTTSGALSTSYTSYFMRVTSYEDLSEMYCVYAIDGDSFNSKSQVMPQNGSFHFDLDLSELEEGLHYISFMLYSDRGTSTTPQLRFFVKTPLGGNGITRYQYWLNDESISTAKTVTLSEKVNPLQLMSLLPVESRPLRSSQFHFDVSSGKPMIYAKNTIHLRFHDVAQRFSDVAKDYVDYSQSREVKPVGELQATQTFAKVAENDVRWYTIQVAPGDTTAFKLSQPATVQVFAPSGAEVFKTSESASVKWGGIHTWENGTYYLAVHDVTGSQSTMKLDYMHMDKYDVVDWDVHRVGNGGCSTITFKGNGFRDLYAVDLIVAPGDTIHSVYVSHDSDAETAATFDFTAATLGDYNAVFHFTEEDKHVANVVTVEEAVDIELATDVTFPSSFLRGTSTTYTIKITNKGNMTAYNVPLSIKISNSSNNDISHVSLDGLGLKKLFDYMEDFDGWSQSEIESFRLQCDEIGEDHYFVKLKTANENGDSIFVRTGLFGLSVPPYTTKTITLTLTSSENVEVWIAAAKEVEPLTSNIYILERSKPFARRKTSWFCCYYDRFVCIANIIVDLSDLVALGFPAASIASCAAGISSSLASAAGIAFCGEETEMNLLDRIKAGFSSLSPSIAGVLISCGGLNKYIKMIKELSDLFNKISVGIDLFTLRETMSNCKTAFTQTKPDCPPNPGGGGGTSEMRNSWEPNDMLGYVAESGSKAIKEGHTDVWYTIQFENDTVFATAPAHDIYLTDTLDANLFDLSTYRPTRITIGAKSMELTGERNFISTMDMRPEINAIAQIEGTINDKNGIVRWHISSLDPMTMEPSDDPMVGVLPVNFDGSGLGEASFDISLKPNLPDGTIIPNRSGNVFDNNETVLTPTWTNIVDAVSPTSIVDGLTLLNDSTLRVFADASDARSGVWKYEWYVQHGENAPWWKEGETFDDCFDFHFYEGFDYGFCVVVTDSAGNVEKKELARERIFKSYGDEFEEAVSLNPLSASPDGNSRIYDLSGRRHDEPQEGVNIINKKKILFRRRGK